MRMLIIYVTISAATLLSVGNLCASPTCGGSGANYQCTSASVCKTDVREAINAIEVNGGGIVNIPAGDTADLSCDWTGDLVNVETSGRVEIIGAGIDRTIIRSAGTSQVGFISFNQSYTNDMPFVRLSGMTLKGRIASGAPAVGFYDAGEFRLDHVYLRSENTSSAGAVLFKATRKGVIDNCKFETDDTDASSCSPLQAYGVTQGSLYAPFPLPTDHCYSQVCNCTVGSRAVYRSSAIPSGNTVIARLDRNNDASAVIDNAGGSQRGTVKSVYVYIASVGKNPSIDLGAFAGSGNVLSARGFAANVPVKEGHNWLRAGSDFTAFDITQGEYIGAYLNNCALAAGSSPSDGGTSQSAHWVAVGDQIPVDDFDFGPPQFNNVSLWAEIHDGEGAMAACESEWDQWWKSTSPNRGGGYWELPQDHTWKPTASDDKAIFVEDCQFKWYYAGNEGNWGSNARVVYRNNRFILPIGIDSACQANASRITMKPGGNFAQIYNNFFDYYSFTHNTIVFDAGDRTIRFTPDSNGFWDFRDVFRSGDTIAIIGSDHNEKTLTLSAVDKTALTVTEALTDEPAGNMVNIRVYGLDRRKTVLYISVDALIYNNTFGGFAYSISPIMYKEYSDFVFSPAARPHNMHMFDNHYFNMYCGNTDGWDCAKPYQSMIANGWINLMYRAPEPGDALYGFGEHSYPHPLRGSDPDPDPDLDSDPDPGPGPDPSNPPASDSSSSGGNSGGCFLTTMSKTFF